jgi:hypothetical protein
VADRPAAPVGAEEPAHLSRFLPQWASGGYCRLITSSISARRWQGPTAGRVAGPVAARFASITGTGRRCCGNARDAQTIGQRDSSAMRCSRSAPGPMPPGYGHRPSKPVRWQVGTASSHALVRAPTKIISVPTTGRRRPNGPPANRSPPSTRLQACGETHAPVWRPMLLPGVVTQRVMRQMRTARRRPNAEPPAVCGCCCSVTPLPVPSGSKSRAGTRSETPTPMSPIRPADDSGSLMDGLARRPALSVA